MAATWAIVLAFLKGFCLCEVFHALLGSCNAMCVSSTFRLFDGASLATGSNIFFAELPYNVASRGRAWVRKYSRLSRGMLLYCGDSPTKRNTLAKMDPYTYYIICQLNKFVLNL